jgi:D-alanyl-D-alanine carboxypeptidase
MDVNDLDADHFFLYDVSAKEMVFCNTDPLDALYPASITKLFSAWVALQILSEDAVVKAGWELGLLQPGSSSAFIALDSCLTVEMLIEGMLLPSGNDAALVLADACCGSVDAFVEEMNRKAQELGLVGTSFANPNGLDHEKHYSTAEDMAKLAAYAVNNPVFVRFCSTIQVSIGGRTMSNHNRLLREVDGCIGLKTGYTKAAGRTLVSCVRRNGCTLVAVTLQDGDDWADHKALYEFGFNDTAS